MPTKNSLSALSLAGTMLLAGCGPLISFGSSAPPPALLTLENTQPPVPVALDAVIAQVDVPADYAGVRIAVKSEPTLVEYLPGVQWIDRPERLLRRATQMAYTPAAGGSTGGLRPTLYLTVRALHIVASGGTHAIRVAFDVRLPRSKGGDGGQCAVDAPLASLKPLDISRGFNAAVFTCFGQIAGWLNKPAKV